MIKINILSPPNARGFFWFLTFVRGVYRALLLNLLNYQLNERTPFVEGPLTSKPTSIPLYMVTMFELFLQLGLVSWEK